MSAQTLPLFLSVALFILQNYLRHQSIETNERYLRTEYDYIVVGSGTGGSVVAGRLSEDGHSNVLLLEAGGPSGGNTDIPGAYWNFFNTRIDWNYTMEPQFVGRAYVAERIPENKGLVIGGSSSVNTFIYNRGNPRDFDTWEKAYGAQGWGWKDVLPYFLKYENNTDPLLLANGMHSTGGPVEVTSWAKPSLLMQLHQQAIQEFGFREIDINSGEQDGTAFAQAFIDGRGVRSSASNSYIDPNPNPHNLHIFPNSFVTRVILKGKRAVGVEFVRNGHSQQVFARKEVIVSAGAINSPQLLMLSGIGPKEELSKFGIPVEADLPVGLYMQNHPGVAINHRVKDEYRFLAGEMASGTMTQLQEFFANNQGPMAQHYRCLTYSTTKNNPNRKWPNWNMSTGPYLFAQNLTQLTVTYGARRHEWDQYNTPFLGKPYIYCHTILQRARSRGYVRLQSNNPFVYPAINPKFLTHPLDLEDMVEALSFSFRFFETSSISQYVVPHAPIPGCKMCPHGYVYECESYLRCVIEEITDSNFHPVGTVRMGDPHSEDTVLDPRLRVKGIDGLRVCDASVMPQINNANINAAIFMIGEKCADLVKQDNNNHGQLEYSADIVSPHYYV